MFWSGAQVNAFPGERRRTTSPTTHRVPAWQACLKTLKDYKESYLEPDARMQQAQLQQQMQQLQLRQQQLQQQLSVLGSQEFQRLWEALESI